MERDSIIYSAIRSLFKGIFFVAGLFLAFIPLVLIFAAMFSSTAKTTEQTTTTKVLTDAEGKRTVSSTAPVLLQVNIDGIIGLNEITKEKIRTQLTESREEDYKDNRVKGILLHINSPGGTVVDADDIYRALKEYKAQHKVPIVAFVDGLCASGGVYIACAADKIYSSPASIVGSVGVIFPSFLNLSQLLEKIGVQSLTISSGKGKDDLNPLRPWKPGEDAQYKVLSNYYYDFFVDIVTSNRPQMNKEKLVNEYGASVFPATEAKEKGYIDESNFTRSQALTQLAKDSGLEGKTYQVVQLETGSFWTQLLKAESPILTGKIKHEINVSDFDPSLSGKFLYLYQPLK